MKNLSRHLRREHMTNGVVRGYDPSAERSKVVRKAGSKARRAFRKANDRKLPSIPPFQEMTTAQKRRYLDSLTSPERERSSDIMDSGRVSLGGGYGLGRNRKH